MQIFDVHTHVFPDPIAHRAVEHLRLLSHGIPAFHNGTLSDHAEKAQRAGICGWMNCPVATTARQVHSLNEHSAATNHWPHLSMGGLFPAAPLEETLAEIEHIHALNLCGVKLHPEYQGFTPLDERLSPVWARLAELKLPVLFHAGLDVGFPGQRHSSPADCAELARRFPSLTIICAHMGGWMDWDQVEEKLAGSNVYLDTSFAKMWMADQKQFERIIRKHGFQHILFGTDSPWSKPDEAIADIMNAPFDESEKKAIFWDNADRIFNFSQVASNA